MTTEMILFAVLAISYIIITRLAVNKFTNRAFVVEYQKKMNDINKRFAEYAKKKDDKAMQALHEEQKRELIPGMSKLMVEQVKMMAIFLVAFSIAMYLIPYIEESAKDDISKTLTIQDPSFDFYADNTGIWRISVLRDNREIGTFHISVGTDKIYPNAVKVDNDLIQSDKQFYKEGEKATIFLTTESSNSSYVVKADKATRSEIILNLPFVEKVEGGYWMFIFMMIVFSLIVSIGEAIYKKITEKKQ